VLHDWSPGPSTQYNGECKLHPNQARGGNSGGNLEDNCMTLHHTVWPARESLIINYCLPNPPLSSPPPWLVRYFYGIVYQQPIVTADHTMRSDTEAVLLEQQRWKNNGFAYPFTLCVSCPGLRTYMCSTVIWALCIWRTRTLCIRRTLCGHVTIGTPTVILLFEINHSWRPWGNHAKCCMSFDCFWPLVYQSSHVYTESAECTKPYFVLYAGLQRISRAGAK